MNIKDWDEQAVTVVQLGGRIDSDGEVELEQTLLAVIADGRNKIVLDMESVEFISSSGLRILANTLVVTQQAGGNLVLGTMSNKIRRIMEIIGFHNFFHMYDNTEAAIIALQ